MKDFLRNIPFINWLNWKIKVIILLLKNRDKHLKIDSSVRFSDVVFSDYNALYKNVDIYTSKIGRFVYIAPDTKIFDTQVGSFCSIGPGCKIGLGDHPVDHISTSPVFFSPHNQCLINFHQDKMFNENLPITIGNDVWIGANVIILNGIIIGDGAIVAAGAVVTKNVPPYAIVAGVPAKILKYRFSFDNIAILQKLKWWDKDIDWLKENASLFSNPHLFFNTYAK